MRDNLGVISPQVLSEFYVTVTQKIKKPIPPEQARFEVELLSVMATVDVDASLVLEAIDNKLRYRLSYWDSEVRIDALEFFYTCLRSLGAPDESSLKNHSQPLSWGKIEAMDAFLKQKHFKYRPELFLQSANHSQKM